MGLQYSDPIQNLVEDLTPREQDILALIAQNLTDREIAGRLTLAVSTVKWYARQIYGKLEVANRRQAISKANSLGLFITKNKSSIPRHNLPRQLTKFIGRNKEIDLIIDWTWKYPLITLTRAGGVGKTRLALAIADKLQEDFSGGIWLVELATLTDPKQVLKAMASAVGLREEPGFTLLDTLGFFFNDRQALLILDNCEHLVDECARVVNSLLQRVPEIKVMTTSREPLGVEGERIFRVPSLKIPPEGVNGKGLSLEELLGFESVQLFLDRAQTKEVEFEITPQNSAGVARICQRLDGIPLAIELAASRVVSLEVDQIAARLEHDLRMLAGGSRTAVERQRTLRATIEWSYNLLSEKERRLMCSLAVFSGGWTLPAAEAVCADEAISRDEVMDLLTCLANKSVVQVDRQPGKDIRYRFLEPIRHFAVEKMSEGGEGNAIRRRHCDWFLHYAENMEPNLYSREATAWVKILKADHENLRAALKWSVGENRDPEGGLRIMVALTRRYWWINGDVIEGHDWLETAMAAVEADKPIDPLFRVKTLINMAWIKTGLNAIEEIPRLDKAIKLCNDLDPPAWLYQGLAYCELGWLEAFGIGKLSEGLLHMNEAETLLRKLGYEGKRHLATLLGKKIWILAQLKNKAGEQVCSRELAELFQEIGDFVYNGHKFLGDVHFRRGEYDLAISHYNQQLALSRELEEYNGTADTIRKLAEVAKAQGHYEQAGLRYRESLKLFYDHGDQIGMIWLLASLAFIHIETSRNMPIINAKLGYRWSARLLGATQTLVGRAGLSHPMPVELMPEYERVMDFLKNNLTSEELSTCMTEGGLLKVSQAVAYALGDPF